MVTFKNISEEDFLSRTDHLFYEQKYLSRRFGEISDGQSSFNWAWQSDLVEPVILEVNPNIYAIGIDQYFAIVDFSKSEVLYKKLDFISFFCDVKTYKKSIYIIEEVSILQIDKTSYTFIKEYGLPDIYSEISFDEDRIYVTCIDSETIFLD